MKLIFAPTMRRIHDVKVCCLHTKFCTCISVRNALYRTLAITCNYLNFKWEISPLSSLRRSINSTAFCKRKSFIHFKFFIRSNQLAYCVQMNKQLNTQLVPPTGTVTISLQEYFDLLGLRLIRNSNGSVVNVVKQDPINTMVSSSPKVRF